MGEVYRARDTRLKREVALKILPASFAGDPDRLARFQREAEVLAALNHPLIAAIYGLEDAPGGDGSPVRALAWSSSKARHSPIALPAARCRPARPCQSRGRSPKRSRPRTSSASSTAT
jgi:serine/threonine protein kinase